MKSGQINIDNLLPAKQKILILTALRFNQNIAVNGLIF